MDEIKYGSLINRIKAIIIDGLVLVGFGIIATTILSEFENVDDSVRLIIFVFIFLLYDPIFVSIFGATIGHLIIGLKVRRENNLARKIIFPLALVRFTMKVLLGWISLLTVPSNEKSKAIHDSVVRSVVLQA